MTVALLPIIGLTNLQMMLGYPMLYKFLQTFTGITQDNRWLMPNVGCQRILQRFSQNAGLLLWRHCELGGCIWGLRLGRLHQPLLRQQQGRMVPGAARPANEPPTPPAGEGAEAGDGNPAPGEGAAQRPATSKPGCSHCEK